VINQQKHAPKRKSVISAPLVNSFSLFLLLQKILVVMDTIYMPGERSKSPDPWLQSLHAISLSLPSCGVELMRSCQAAPRKACTPRAGSLLACQLLPALQHSCRCAPVGFAPASPNRSRAQSCQVASASLQGSKHRGRDGMPGSPVQAGNLDKEGSANAGWSINAGPDWEETEARSCFEWGIKKQC